MLLGTFYKLMLERLTKLLLVSLTCACAHAQAINLAKYQTTLSSSNGDATSQNEATDGVVSNQSRWYTTASGPHWLEVQLTESFTLGSAHLYLGKDDGFTISNFTLQYANGSGWQTIRTYSGNTATDINCIFPAPIVANRFRLTTNETARIKEIALFAPNNGNGYPLGTDVILSLGRDRPIDGSSTNSSNYPYKAIDGYVDDNSRYLSANNTGPHTLTVDFGSLQKTGGFHLYTGFGNGSPLAEFTVHTHDGTSWSTPQLHSVSSGSITNPNRVTGNTSNALTVLFPPGGLETERVQVKFTVPYGRIREFVVFPANKLEDGTHGYPIWSGVTNQPRPNTNFKDYHDAWHRLALRQNNNSLLPTLTGSTQAITSTPTEDKQLQLLYLKSRDAYRIRQQSSGKCLEVANASTSPDASIVLSNNYSAAPHQLWRLVPTDNGWFQIINLWSGLALTSNGATPGTITQQNPASGPIPNTQQWQAFHQADDFKKGTGGWVGSFGTAWGYDWARNDKDGLAEHKFYAPMQHREGWPNLGTLHKKRHDWNNDHKMNVLLGFNEPDRPDQANMGVNKAVELWPRLMDLDIPLVSPACSLGGEWSWLNSWNNQISNKGYRCEYAGAHWYSGPSSTNLLNYIDTVQSATGGKPVWLTEFSVVDWSNGNGDWSEETNYNFILEFLWRAEAKNNLRKYAIFIFSGGAPTNPWDRTNPRSNFRQNNGTLHPFGKAYAAWDGDKTIRTQQPYLIHNRNARHRLRNDGTNLPTQSWIRREDTSVQWYLEDAGSGRFHLTSIVDNTRLRYTNGTLDFAPALTTGPEVEWTYNREQYGWHNIIHPQSGRYLRLNRQNDFNNAPTSQTFEMVTASAASGYSSTDWWFVKPHSPASINLPNPNESYPSWAAAHNLPANTPQGDADSDGLSNLLEYFFLTDPTTFDPSPLQINAEQHLTFPRNTAANDLNWSLQKSGDLGETDPWTTTSYTIRSNLPNGNDTQQLIISPLSGQAASYFRIQVTLAP